MAALLLDGLDTDNTAERPHYRHCSDEYHRMSSLPCRAPNDTLPMRAGFAAMPELRALHASFNQLTGVLPSAWAAPALQQLGVRANMFAGPLPASLASLPALAVLDLQVRKG